MAANEIIATTQKAKTCLRNASKGDVLIMPPLLVNSSSAALNPRNRRVIHGDYSYVNLPNGLNWHGS